MGPNPDRRRLQKAWTSAHLRAGHLMQGRHALISHWLRGGKAKHSPAGTPAGRTQAPQQAAAQAAGPGQDLTHKPGRDPGVGRRPEPSGPVRWR